MDSTILKIDNISKSFPRVKANKNISFNVERNTVHALLGENGAGKSTFVKVLYGLLKPDEGVIYFKNNLANCLKEQKVVIKDIKESLTNSKLIDMGQQTHKEKDNSIRSNTYNSYIEFDNGFLDITCTDWTKSYESKNKTVTDSLKISFITKELDSWLHNEAWK